MVGRSVDLSKAESSRSLQSKSCITTIFAKLHDYSGLTGGGVGRLDENFVGHRWFPVLLYAIGPLVSRLSLGHRPPDLQIIFDPAFDAYDYRFNMP